MSAGRDELHQLIDSLSEEQVGQVLSHVQRRTSPRPAPSDKAFAWITMGRPGMGGPTTPNVDELLAEGFGRD